MGGLVAERHQPAWSPHLHPSHGPEDRTRALDRLLVDQLDEPPTAMASADASTRPDARPFDVIVIGGGSFRPIFTEHRFVADKTRGEMEKEFATAADHRGPRETEGHEPGVAYGSHLAAPYPPTSRPAMSPLITWWMKPALRSTLCQLRREVADLLRIGGCNGVPKSVVGALTRTLVVCPRQDSNLRPAA